MEEISVIISLVTLVFGVMQIILFFKIWHMTDDVQAIKKKMMPAEPTELQKKMFLLKEIEKKSPNIANILFEAIYEEMSYSYKNKYQEGKYEKIVEKYKELYDRAKLDIPEVFVTIKTNADYRRTFLGTAD